MLNAGFGQRSLEEEILEDLVWFEFLSVDQIRRKLFRTAIVENDRSIYKSVRSVNRVMSNLVSRGAVKRFRFPRTWKHNFGTLYVPSPRWLLKQQYFLSESERRKTRRRLKRKFEATRNLLQASRKHAVHEYFLNQAIIWLLQESKRVQGSWTISRTPRLYNRKEIKPDAHLKGRFEYWQSTEFDIYIELDRNTECYSVLSQKFKHYGNLMQKSNQLLLLIEPSARRDRDIISSLVHENRIGMRTLMTSLADSLDEHWLTNRVWYDLMSEEEMSLIDKLSFSYDNPE